jgi:exosortase C (VPDSG-CTERM-specific)
MNEVKSHPFEPRFSHKHTPSFRSGLKVRTVIQVLGLMVLFIGFAPYFMKLARFAFHSDLYSYILLIPPCVIYLLYLNRNHAPVVVVPNLPLATTLLCIAFLALILSQVGALANSGLPENDRLGLPAFAFVTFAIGGIVLTWGSSALRVFAFPLFFLYFLIPLPSWFEKMLTHFLQSTSADLFYGLFSLTGIPILRDGYYFQLPGLTLVVAEECSGIRSTMVLILTGFLAAHLFLRTSWRKSLLVLCAFAIGVLRNSVRIVTLAFLTVKLSSKIISGPLHHQGGTPFFILSLVPFLIVLFLLRKSEAAARCSLTHE